MTRLEKASSLVLICVLGLQAIAQTAQPATTSTPMPAQETKAGAFTFGLFDGTPVKLKIGRTVSSADAKVNDTVDFEILEDIKSGDTVLIPKGGFAFATVTEAKPKRSMGRAGKLNMNIDYVRLITGEKIPLRAVKEAKGGTRTATVTTAMVAAGILFFPAAPLFLFIRGKDITIPKGTEITAYINGDFPLDQAKFAAVMKTQTMASTEAANAQPTAATDPESSGVSIKSTPDGSEISVDGKFVGSTPSTLRLKAGDHVIMIKKTGYVDWTRTVTLTAAGNITIEANLEKMP